MKNTIIFGVLAALFITAFAGCGGGGGGSEETPSTPIVNTNVIRQIQSGDQIIYDVTGTLNTGNASSDVSGTITMSTNSGSISAIYGGKPFNLVTAVSVKSDTNVSLSKTSTEFYEQTSNGSIYKLGGNYGSGNVSLISTAGGDYPYAYKSPVSVGNSYSYTAHYTDGSSDQTSINVLSTEAISNQTSYKIHILHSDGSTITTTDKWLVPGMGYPVKISFTITNASGTWTLTGIMKSKSF